MDFFLIRMLSFKFWKLKTQTVLITASLQLFKYDNTKLFLIAAYIFIWYMYIKITHLYCMNWNI